MTGVTTGKYRWTVVALLFFATTINYIDRQVLGLLKPVLEKDLNWSETDYGNVVMAFSAAYALGLLLFGRLVDYTGSKTGYIISVVIWSIAAMAHAMAGTTMGFAFARGLLGLGEAGNFPAAIKAVAEWFPKRERSFATGLFNSGTNIGAMVAPLMVPWVLGIWGWQMAFLITGAMGFVWLIFWWRMYEIPSRHARISAAEYAYIHDGQQEAIIAAEPVSWIKLLRVRQTWAYIFGKIFTDPVWWFFLFWIPSYFASTFHLDLKKPSLELALLYTSTTIGSVGGGYLPGYLHKKGWPMFKARKTAMLLFAILVIPVMFTQFVTNIWMAVALISLAASSHQAWSANMFTTASDMFPQRAVSSIVGIGGMAGAVGGILFPMFVGRLLDIYKAAGDITAGYNLLFVGCSCTYLLAWGLMHLFAPRLEQVSLND